MSVPLEKLTQVKYEIAIEEIEEEFFGRSTSSAVIKFHELHGLLNHSADSQTKEIVDQDIAHIINREQDIRKSYIAQGTFKD